jgi:uncharacterized protein involved in exopolysaccharide biosynthesis
MNLEEDDKFKKSDSAIRAARNLDFIIKVILKKWWLFFIVGLITGLAGIYYASRQKINYESKLTFALDQGESGSAAMSLAAQFGLNMNTSNDVFAGDNIIEIMKSRRMVERALLCVDTFQTKPYTFIEYYLQQNRDPDSKEEIRSIHFPVGQPRTNFSYAQDSVLFKVYNDFVKRYIDADKPDRKNNIYEVNVTNPDEKFTKDFTDTLVSETNKFYIEISTKKSKQTLDILEQRVAAMKGNVNSSIGNMAEIQDVNLNPAFSAAEVPVLKQQADVRVYSGAYAEMFKNLEVARYQYLKQIPLMQVIDAANYPMKKIKVSKLKTAIIFSFVACFITFLVIWIINLFKLKKD